MAAEKPRFPDPPKRENAPPYRAIGAAVTPEVPRKLVVVTRPEPLTEGPDGKPVPKLTPEELRALLAVASVEHRRWRSTGRRSIILVPVGLIGHLLHTVLGDYSFVAVGAIAIGAFAWVARPLLAKDGFT